jgi:phosphoserine phosphatase
MNIAFDLEGTLTTGRTWKGMGSYLAQHGRGAPYRAFFLTRLPGTLLARIGLIDHQNFGNQWVIDLAHLLRGFGAVELEEMAQWVVEREMWQHRRMDIMAEVERYTQAGHRVILATGTYQPIANAFARKAGMASAIGTPLAVREGRAVGGLAGPLNVKRVKAERLQVLLAGDTLDMAYGDTLADVPMLEMCAKPVVVYPDRRLLKIAQKRRWQIVD